ncbi:hypothetical protein ACFSL6_00085 [Paenibacillus thailandensis]|uniref:hypothetical protein n=1 Tax=Paenibacillus thailandensis TaxID=393250 RepID=UPI003625F3A8
MRRSRRPWDQVLVGSMDRTRAGRIKVSYVLGANDGVMPMRVKEDGILTKRSGSGLARKGSPWLRASAENCWTNGYDL